MLHMLFIISFPTNMFPIICQHLTIAMRIARMHTCILKDNYKYIIKSNYVGSLHVRNVIEAKSVAEGSI